MTVTYAAQVATCKGLGVFWKLLFCWKASIYKLIWPNLLVYVIFWYALKGLYLCIPDNEFRYFFIKISMYCNSYSQFIPLTFILGFYVNLVVKRWWEMFQALPGLDTIAIFVSTSIHGQDERSRLLRRTIIRYCNLAYVMVMSMISTPVKKRFPTMKHMMEAGLLNENEYEIFEEMNKKATYAKYWMPIVWAGSIVSRARKEGRIRDDFAVKTLLDELCKFRSGCGMVLGYDWVPIPLVYTQAVTIAVYTYCVSTLCGSQFIFKTFKSDIEKQFASEFTSNSTEDGVASGLEFIRNHRDTNVIYFPLFDFLQFFFYMGWMKVAESLVNPFGEDDDDFETNFLVDKHLRNTYLIVDDMHQQHPTLLKDQYWDSIVPELPYTYASDKFRKDQYMGSAANISVDSEELDFVPMEPVTEEGEEASPDEENGLQTGDKTDTKPPSRRPSVSGSISRTNSRPGLRQKASMIGALARAFGSRGDNVAGSRISLASTRRNTRRVSRQNSRATDGPMTRTNTLAEEMFNMSGLSLNKLGVPGENGLSGSKLNLAAKTEPIKIEGADDPKPDFVVGSDTSSKKMVYAGDDLDVVDTDLNMTRRREVRLDSLLEEDSDDRRTADRLQFIDEEIAPLITLNSPVVSAPQPPKINIREATPQLSSSVGKSSPRPIRKEGKDSPKILDAPLSPKSLRFVSPLSLLIEGSNKSPSASPQHSPRSSVTPRPPKLSREKHMYKPVRDEDDSEARAHRDSIHRDTELETIEEDLSVEDSSVEQSGSSLEPLIDSGRKPEIV